MRKNSRRSIAEFAKIQIAEFPNVAEFAKIRLHSGCPFTSFEGRPKQPNPLSLGT